MRLIGRLIKSTVIVQESDVELFDENISFTDLLSKCLVENCRRLDITVPVWMDKNTKEFARYRKTFFTQEQFLETVYFDKFEIQLEKDR